MKAGYTIDQPDFLIHNDRFLTVDNYHGLNGVVIRACSYDTIEDMCDEYTVAIFRIVPCDDCGKVAKLKEQSCGDRICQSCEDNRNEASAERYANDAESIIYHDLSQYKSLK